MSFCQKRHPAEPYFTYFKILIKFYFCLFTILIEFYKTALSVEISAFGVEGRVDSLAAFGTRFAAQGTRFS